MLSRLYAAVLLVGLLAAYRAFLKADVRDLVARHLAPAADARRRRYVGWLAKAVVLFGGVSLAMLAALGRLGALVVPPAEFDAVRQWVAGVLGPAPLGAADLPYLAGGILAGGLIGGVAARFTRSRRGFVLGNVEAVMPRTWGELGWGALLSLNAGWTEELFFRLALPLLVTLATDDAILGVAAATLLFAHAHRYQGWPGMLATGAVGLLLALVYLWTGLLWLAMVLHALIDLNGLVLRPVIAGALRRGD